MKVVESDTGEKSGSRVDSTWLFEEKAKCEKELQSCSSLLQKVNKISTDYMYCEEKLSQIINYLSEGCSIDGTGVGYSSLTLRKEKMISDLSTVESVTKSLNLREKYLTTRIKWLNNEIAKIPVKASLKNI